MSEDKISLQQRLAVSRANTQRVLPQRPHKTTADIDVFAPSTLRAVSLVGKDALFVSPPGLAPPRRRNLVCPSAALPFGAGSNGPPSSSLLALGNKNRPVVLSASFAKLQSNAHSPLSFAMKALQALLQGGWSAATTAAVQGEYSASVVAEAFSLGMSEVTKLCCGPTVEKTSEDLMPRLLLMLRLIVAKAPLQAFTTPVTSDPKAFSRIPLILAAEHFAVKCYDILLPRTMEALAGDELRADPKASEIFLIMATNQVLGSSAWAKEAEAGREILRRLLVMVESFFSEADGCKRQEKREELLLHLIPHRHQALLPLFIEEVQNTRASKREQENQFLFFAAQYGWLEGVKTLLEAGVSANDRIAGACLAHPQFSCGQTPLMAALTSQRITDSVALQISQILLDHGANPYIAYVPINEGAQVHERLSVEITAARAGMFHRWQALKANNPSDDLKRCFAVDHAARDILADLEKVATLIIHSTDSTCLQAVIDVLQRSFQLSLQDNDLFATVFRELAQFITSSGQLFEDQGWHKRPYVSGGNKSVNPEIKLVFNGVAYSHSSETVPQRLQLWAKVFMRQKHSMEQSPDDLLKPTNNDLSAWLQDIYFDFSDAHRLKGYLELPVLIMSESLDAAEALYALPGHSSHKEQTLGFLACTSGAQSASSKGMQKRLIGLADKILARCSSAGLIEKLLEATVRLEDLNWLEQVMCKAIQLFDLQAIEAEAATTSENMLHLAAEGTLKVLKALCGGLPAEIIAAWSQQRDDCGDLPLHRAARMGPAHVKALLSRLRAKDQQALLTVMNGAGRSPAIEALVSGQAAVFCVLTRMNQEGPKATSWVLALSARKGLLTAELLQSLRQHPGSASALHTHARQLACRLIRLGDQDSLKTLVQECGPQVLTARRNEATVMHTLARANNHALLPILTAAATPGQLRQLLSVKDGRGRYAEACTQDAGLRSQLLGLAGRAQTAQPPRELNTSSPWLIIDRAVKRVSEQNKSAQLESAVRGFCKQADELLLGHAGNQKLQQHIHRRAWEVVDHIDRAPATIGIRMGTHFAMHRPDVTEKALVQRCQDTRTGASRFGAQGGLALLKARAEAISQSKSCVIRPGLKKVIDVPANGLQAVGFCFQHGNIVAIQHSDMLRTVFAQSAQGLILVTAYAL